MRIEKIQKYKIMYMSKENNTEKKKSSIKLIHMC